jgi:hypothetical protein
MAPKKKFVRLTCECGMKYTLGTPDDIGRKCVKCRALPTNTTDPYERGKYNTSIESLIGVVKLGNDYKKELDAAKSMSEKVKSPYTVSILVRR